MRRLTTIMAVACIWAGCGDDARNHPVTGVQEDGTPKWVHRGSGTFATKGGGKAFFGVGIGEGSNRESMLRKIADNQARGEIAKMFDLYVGAMMKDYQRATTAGDFKATAEEQDVVAVQKTITDVSMTGIEIRDHWVNPATGAMYTLAVLDLENMAGAMDRAKQLNAQVREFVRQNARKAFEDLNRELKARRESGR